MDEAPVVVVERKSRFRRIRLTRASHTPGEKITTPRTAPAKSTAAWKALAKAGTALGWRKPWVTKSVASELRRLHAARATAFKPDDDDAHEALLRQFWRALSSEPFTRAGEVWKSLGFQGVNPATDVRGGGLLAVMCLAEFAADFGAGLRRMLQQLAEAASTLADGSTSERFYPVSTTAIVICCRLCDAIGISDGMRGAIGEYELERRLKDEATLLRGPLARLLVLAPRRGQRSAFQWLFAMALASFHVKFVNGNCTYLDAQPLLGEVFLELERVGTSSTSISDVHSAFVADADVAACLDARDRRAKQRTARAAAAVVRLRGSHIARWRPAAGVRKSVAVERARAVDALDVGDTALTLSVQREASREERARSSARGAAAAPSGSLESVSGGGDGMGGDSMGGSGRQLSRQLVTSMTMPAGGISHVLSGGLSSGGDSINGLTAGPSSTVQVDEDMVEEVVHVTGASAASARSALRELSSGAGSQQEGDAAAVETLTRGTSHETVYVSFEDICDDEIHDETDTTDASGAKRPQGEDSDVKVRSPFSLSPFGDWWTSGQPPKVNSPKPTVSEHQFAPFGDLCGVRGRRGHDADQARLQRDLARTIHCREADAEPAGLNALCGGARRRGHEAEHARAQKELSRAIRVADLPDLAHAVDGRSPGRSAAATTARTATTAVASPADTMEPNMEPHPCGTLVLISGIGQPYGPELNGKIATVLAFQPPTPGAKARYRIRLPSGKQVYLKPNHVSWVSHGLAAENQRTVGLQEEIAERSASPIAPRGPLTPSWRTDSSVPMPARATSPHTVADRVQRAKSVNRINNGEEAAPAIDDARVIKVVEV